MSATPKPPPGYLSNAEADELLAPMSEFSLFVRDMITHRFVYALDETAVGEVGVKVFNYAHSMGHGGGLLYGESDWATCMVELPGADLPHFQIRPKTILNRLRTLFAKKLGGHDSTGFYRRYLVVCDNPSALKGRISNNFKARMADLPKPVSMEGKGDHFVGQRRGALRPPEQREFAEFIGELAGLLVSGGASSPH